MCKRYCFQILLLTIFTEKEFINEYKNTKVIEKRDKINVNILWCDLMKKTKYKFLKVSLYQKTIVELLNDRMARLFREQIEKNKCDYLREGKKQFFCKLISFWKHLLDIKLILKTASRIIKTEYKW